MRNIYKPQVFLGTESVSQSADETSDVRQSAIPHEDDWFGRIARPLLAGTDAGYSLHLLTGFTPGTCGHYVARTRTSHRQPPGFFIRALLRSDQGAIWLAALMDGCEAPWWRDLQGAARVLAQIK